MRSCISLACVLGLGMATVGAAAAQQWSRFRGPNGTGVSREEGLPDQLDISANVEWKLAIDGGTSSPVIWKDTLFLSSFSDTKRQLQCIDTGTGKVRWTRSVDKVRDENVTPVNGPATCTPVTVGKHVVVFFPDAALLCYSMAGELQWQRDLGPFKSMHGIANSPIIVGNLVIQLIDQLQGSYIAACDVATGKPAWKVDRIDALTGGFSTPSVYRPAADKTLVMATGARGLFAYDAKAGNNVWSVPGVSNSPVTIPVLWKSQAILCEPVGKVESFSMLSRMDRNKDGKIDMEEAKRSVAMSRFLHRIDTDWGNGDGVVDEAEWNAAFGATVGKGGLVSVALHGAATADQVKVQWTYTKSIPYIASPVVYRNVIYIIQDGGILTAVDPRSGKAIKRGRLKKGGAKFYSSPVAGDGKVYLIDTAGQVTVVSAAGAEWSELSTTKLDAPCFATPAIAGKRIFVRTNKSLFCFAP